MLDKTVDNALCRLRVKIIREGLDGLPHVEALLTMRGVCLTTVPPPVRSDCQHFFGVRPVVLATLQGGARTTGQIGNAIVAARQGMDRKQAMIRVCRMLYKLRDKGVVLKDGGVWVLVVTLPAANNPSRRG